MSVIKDYNKSIKKGLKKDLKKGKKAFQKIVNDAHPLFREAVDKLLQLDYKQLKAEMTTMLLESCEKWMNDDQYDNTPMDAILFEYDYIYLDEVEAVAYGIDGDLSSGKYDFVNGMEAHHGILLKPFPMLSFIDEDYEKFSEEIGYEEVNVIFIKYIYLLVQEAFAAFTQSNIFKKISRKEIFYIALGEHDMGETPLYYVCDDDAIFQNYLTKEDEAVAAVEREKKLANKHYELKYHIDELLDDLAYNNDFSKISEIFEGLDELINHSEYANWAMLKLGSLYLSGKGVPSDFDKAREYFEKVLEDGRSLQKRQSYMMLGSMYYSGKGVVKNILKAHEYLINANRITELSSRFLALKAHIEKEIQGLKN